MGLKDFFVRDKKSNGAKDPICGMRVNLETTNYKSTYQGKVYGFCSEGCKKTFDSDPAQYAKN